MLMFVGAMGGSTSGGFKVIRAVAIGKHALGSFKLIAHPRAVVVDRLGAKTVGPDLFLNLVGLFALYAGAHGLGTLVLAGLGADLLTATSAALAAISNVGPGLGAVGPESSYAALSDASQVVLTVLMLLGRLEFYALILLILPGTWRRR